VQVLDGLMRGVDQSMEVSGWHVTCESRSQKKPLLLTSNGTGVSAFLLSGEVLRQRYQLDVVHVGMSVTAFGIGLGIGNLSAGTLQRVTGSEERSLIVVTGVLIASVAAFNLLSLWLFGALVCLAAWGAALTVHDALADGSTDHRKR
jgi:predicted MFS family arabinose efflux permease